MTLKDADRHSLIENYRDKSHAAIDNVAFLIDNDKLTIAVNQMYYGIFYMLSAVAVQEGFVTSKHKQIIGWFNKTYIKNGRLDAKYSKMIRSAFENRMEGDYNVLAHFTLQEVQQSFADMQDVIAAIEKLLETEGGSHDV